MDSDDEAELDRLALEAVTSAASNEEEDGDGDAPVYRSLGGLNVVPISTEARAGPVLEIAFLTWNINGNALNVEDAAVWAASAGPADAYFVGIQELIDIEAKEGRVRASRAREWRCSTLCTIVSRRAWQAFG